MTVYQTPVSDFADHADALEQSCTDLTGQLLVGSDGLPSLEAITPPDCAQLPRMIAAVELLDASDPVQLPAAAVEERARIAAKPGRLGLDIFRDTFEAGPGGWKTSHTTPSASFTPRDWGLVSELPARDGSAFFGVDPNIGRVHADIRRDRRPASRQPEHHAGRRCHGAAAHIRLPGRRPSRRSTADSCGSASVMGRGSSLRASTSRSNLYNAQTAPAPLNTNPMAGMFAFTGTDGGSVDGSWGRSDVDLAPYVSPNQTFRLRFDVGTDGCAGAFGWQAVHDVTVYTCTSNAKPTIPSILNDVAVVEGDRGLTTAAFTVSLSHASRGAGGICSYLILPHTATPLHDYLPFNLDTFNLVVVPPLQPLCGGACPDRRRSAEGRERAVQGRARAGGERGDRGRDRRRHDRGRRCRSPDDERQRAMTDVARRLPCTMVRVASVRGDCAHHDPRVRREPDRA